MEAQPSSSSGASSRNTIQLFGKWMEPGRKNDEDWRKNLGVLVVKKELTKSDVDSSSRLLLPKDSVMEKVIPKLDEYDAQLCKTTKGAEISIYDIDTNSLHTLTLKQWSTKSFVFTGNWITSFVKRRNLKQNDEIELFWDENNQRLNFSVVKQA